MSPRVSILRGGLVFPPQLGHTSMHQEALAMNDSHTESCATQDAILDLFSRSWAEHVPATFHHMLMLPGTLLLELEVLLSLLLVSGSWLSAVMSSLTLLLFLWFLARYTRQEYVVICLRTDLADITKSYLSECGSCFWVADSRGQVVGTVCALPVANSLGKKHLELFHYSVAMECRREGPWSALVRTVIQFAQNQGYGELVLGTRREDVEEVTVPDMPPLGPIRVSPVFPQSPGLQNCSCFLLTVSSWKPQYKELHQGVLVSLVNVPDAAGYVGFLQVESLGKDQRLET
ncbi:LOW QUALITY PROTEIN: N-acetyltransferase family 8 member 3-like [Erethizon dorsatum]